MADIDPEHTSQKAELLVLNRLGLHARAAAQIASLAQQYQANITLEKNGLQADAGNILEILSLGCSPGSKVQVWVQGPEATSALQALRDLFRRRFGEP
jgi:phosphocarrier protein HPr